MEESQAIDEKIEFPPFEKIQIDSIDHFQKDTPVIYNLNNEDFNLDEIIKIIANFINEQFLSELLIYFPQEYLNMTAFSPRANEIYNIVKDQLDNFAQIKAEEIACLELIPEIANKWTNIQKILQNISHYFDIFANGRNSFSEILFSTFNKLFSAQTNLIQLLHAAIIDSFNTGSIQWFSIDSANLLTKCNLFDSMIIINNLDINIETLEQLDFFIQICHTLIPSDQHHHYLNYLTEKMSDFSHFFVEIPQNWKYILSLFEIYEFKGLFDDFVSKFTDLVKSQFTTLNPFQIFDEIHSLGSTNLMFVIRNIATTLFNGQNEMFSILLANYIHTTFMSLKQPINNERLNLFDEFAQLSNGFFIRYHSHNLLKRLLNYKRVVFDADERFSLICGHHRIIAIINDFKNKQKIVSGFSNMSQILTFSVFNREFFSNKIISTPKFPEFFSRAAQSFQDYFIKNCKNTKFIWDFSLMQVTFQVLNIPPLSTVKCNGIAAIILIQLSKKESMKIEDLCKELSLNDQETTETIESLSTFSLVKYNVDHSVSLNTDIKDAIDDEIAIPFIPRVFGVQNQTMVNTMQIEALITRFVKLHPGLPKEEVFKQLNSFSNFSFTEQEFINSLRSLIKKQIISPIDSSKALNLTYP